MDLKIDKNDLKTLEKEYNCYISVNTEKDNCGLYHLSNYPNLHIFKWIKGSKTKSFTYKLPKNKTVTLEWIKQKLDKTSEYKNLQAVFEKLGITGNIYYTSFGFSYMNFLKSKEVFEKENSILKDKLDDLGVKYTCEFSQANWVYRYRISKSKENIDKIKSL